MGTKNIRKGVIKAPVNNGQQITFMALTKQSSIQIEGETVEDKVFLATSRPLWNMKKNYEPEIRINGVVSGCAVTGGSSNDNLENAAGVVNVNGVQVAVAAGTSNSVTRGAASKYTVHALCVDNEGTRSVVAGTDGDSLDLTGGFGGAGQKPLVATTLAVIAYAVTYGDTPAPIPSTDIYMGESANLSFRIEPVRGGIIFLDELEANHTAGVERGVYAQFYELGSSLQAIGKLEEGILVLKKSAPTETPHMDSYQVDRVPNYSIDWDLTVKKWRVDQFWVDEMLDPNSDYFVLEMYEDQSDSHYYRGVGILHGDYNLGIKRGAVSESLNFAAGSELVKTN